MPKRTQKQPDRSRDYRKHYLVPSSLDSTLIEASIDEFGPFPWTAREIGEPTRILSSFNNLTGTVERKDVARCFEYLVMKYNAAIYNEQNSPRPGALLHRLDSISDLANDLAEQLAGMGEDERRISIEGGLPQFGLEGVSDDDRMHLWQSLPKSGGKLENGRLPEGALVKELRLLSKYMAATRVELRERLEDKGGKISLASRRYGSPYWDLAHMVWGLIQRHPNQNPSASEDGLAHQIMMNVHQAVTGEPEGHSRCIHTLKKYARASRGLENAIVERDKLFADAGLSESDRTEFLIRQDMRLSIVPDDEMRRKLIASLHVLERYANWINSSQDPGLGEPT